MLKDIFLYALGGIWGGYVSLKVTTEEWGIGKSLAILISGVMILAVLVNLPRLIF